MTESSRTILIVDDEASQRELLGGFVESLGFQAEEAGSAEEALEKIRRKCPAMVLLDVRLPGMSGIEALSEIREIASNLPVLLITAYADLREAVTAVKGGANDYLAKPVDLDELATVLRATPWGRSVARTKTRGKFLQSIRSCRHGLCLQVLPCVIWLKRWPLWRRRTCRSSLPERAESVRRSSQVLSITGAHVMTDRLWRPIVRDFRNHLSKANCSDIRREPLPARPETGKASSARRTAERFSSMKSANCRFIYSQNCCGL